MTGSEIIFPILFVISLLIQAVVAMMLVFLAFIAGAKLYHAGTMRHVPEVSILPSPIVTERPGKHDEEPEPGWKDGL